MIITQEASKARSRYDTTAEADIEAHSKITALFQTHTPLLQQDSSSQEDILKTLSGLCRAETLPSFPQDHTFPKPQYFCEPTAYTMTQLFDTVHLDYTQGEGYTVSFETPLMATKKNLLLSILKDLVKNKKLPPETEKRYQTLIYLLDNGSSCNSSSVESIIKKAKNLKTNESFLLEIFCKASSSIGHLIILQFTRTENGLYKISIYNAGLGLNIHPYIPSGSRDFQAHEGYVKHLKIPCIHFVDIRPEELGLTPENEKNSSPTFFHALTLFTHEENEMRTVRSLCTSLSEQNLLLISDNLKKIKSREELASNINSLWPSDNSQLTKQIEIRSINHFYSLFAPFEDRLKREYNSCDLITPMRSGNCGYRTFLLFLKSLLTAEEYKKLKLDISFITLLDFFYFVKNKEEELGTTASLALYYHIEQASYKLLRRLAKLTNVESQRGILPLEESLTIYQEIQKVLSHLKLSTYSIKTPLPQLTINLSQTAQQVKSCIRLLPSYIPPNQPIESPKKTEDLIFAEVPRWERNLLENGGSFYSNLENFYNTLLQLWPTENLLVRLHIEEFVSFLCQNRDLFANHLKQPQNPQTLASCNSHLTSILQIYATTSLYLKIYSQNSQYNVYKLTTYIHLCSLEIATQQKNTDIKKFLEEYPLFDHSYLQRQDLDSYLSHIDFFRDTHTLTEEYFRTRKKNPLFNFSKSYNENNIQTAFFETVFNTASLSEPLQIPYQIDRLHHPLSTQKGLSLLFFKKFLNKTPFDYVNELHIASYVAYLFGNSLFWPSSHKQVSLVDEISWDLKFVGGGQQIDSITWPHENIRPPRGATPFSSQTTVKAKVTDRLHIDPLFQESFTRLMEKVPPENSIRIQYHSTKNHSFPIDFLTTACAKNIFLHDLLKYFHENIADFSDPVNQEIFLILFFRSLYGQDEKEHILILKEFNSPVFLEKLRKFIIKTQNHFSTKNSGHKLMIQINIFIAKFIYRIHQLITPDQFESLKPIRTLLDDFKRLKGTTPDEKSSLALYVLALKKLIPVEALSESDLIEIVTQWFLYSLKKSVKQDIDHEIAHEIEFHFIKKILPKIEKNNRLILNAFAQILLNLDEAPPPLEYENANTVKSESPGCYTLFSKDSKPLCILDFLRGTIKKSDDTNLIAEETIISHNDSDVYKELFGEGALFKGIQEGNNAEFKDQRGNVFRIHFNGQSTAIYMLLNKEWCSYIPKRAATQFCQASQIPLILTKEAFFRGENLIYIYSFKENKLLAKIDVKNGDILLEKENGPLLDSAYLNLLSIDSLAPLSPIFEKFESPSYILSTTFNGALHSVTLPRFRSLTNEVLQFEAAGTPHLQKETSSSQMRPLFWSSNKNYQLSTFRANGGLFKKEWLFIFNGILLESKKTKKEKILIPFRPTFYMSLRPPFVKLDLEAVEPNSHMLRLTNQTPEHQLTEINKKDQTRIPEEEVYLFVECDIVDDFLEPTSPEAALYLAYLALSSRNYILAHTYLEKTILQKKPSKYIFPLLKWIFTIPDMSPSASALILKTRCLAEAIDGIEEILDLISDTELYVHLYKYMDGWHNIPAEIRIHEKDHAKLIEIITEQEETKKNPVKLNCLISTIDEFYKKAYNKPKKKPPQNNDVYEAPPNLFVQRLIQDKETRHCPVLPLDTFTKESPLLPFTEINESLLDFFQNTLNKDQNRRKAVPLPHTLFESFLTLYNLCLSNNRTEEDCLAVLVSLRYANLCYSPSPNSLSDEISYSGLEAKSYTQFNQFLRNVLHLALRYPHLVRHAGEPNTMISWYKNIKDLYLKQESSAEVVPADPRMLPYSITGSFLDRKPLLLKDIATKFSSPITTPTPLLTSYPLPSFSLDQQLSEENELPTDSFFRRSESFSRAPLLTTLPPRKPQEIPPSELNYRGAIEESFKKLQERTQIKKPEYLIKDQRSLEILKEKTEAWIEKKERHTSHLKTIIKKLAEKKPTDLSRRYQEELLREGGFTPSIDFKDLINAFLKKDLLAYAKLNPHLTTDDLSILDKLLYEFLIHETYINRARRIVDLLNTENLLDRALMDSIPLQNEVASILQEKIAYDPNQMRACLIYEYLAKIRIREDQINFILQMSQAPQGKNRKLVSQFMMGGGKTTVISAILLYLMSQDKGKFAVFIPPSPQFKTQSINLAYTQRKYFNQGVLIIDFNRNELSEKNLHKVIDMIRCAKTNGDIILMKKEQIQILRLSYLVLISQHSQKAEDSRIDLLRNILKEFEDNAHVIADEADHILNPKQELNFPIGNPAPIPPLYIDLIKNILLLYVSSDLEKDLGLQRNHQSFFPLDRYHNEVAPLIAKQVLNTQGFLHIFLDKEKNYQDSILRYLMGRASYEKDTPFLQFLESCHASQEEGTQISAELLALSSYFINTLFPATMSKKIRRHYGRSLNALNGEVVPFNGEGAEATTKFLLAAETMLYHFLTVLSDGVLTEQILLFADNMHKRALHFSDKQQIPLDQTAEAQEFFNITGILLRDISEPGNLIKATSHVNNRVERKLQLEAETIALLLPPHDKYISDNSHDLVSSFHSFRSFSGTLSNKKSFPRELEVLSQKEIEAAVISKSMEKHETTLISFIDQVRVEDILKETLNRVENPKNVRCIIDVSGLLTQPRLIIAQAILKFYENDPSIQSVLFFDKASQEDIEPNTLMALQKGSPNPIAIYSTLREKIEERGIDISTAFVFYDENHTRATDIPLIPHCTGIVTIGEGLILSDFIQALLRLRLYLTTQNAVYVGHKKAQNAFLNQGVSLPDILHSCAKNEAIYEARESVRSYRQKFLHAIRSQIFKKLLHCPSTQEASELLKKHEQFIIHANNPNPYETFGKVQQFIETKEVLLEYSTNLLRDVEKIEGKKEIYTGVCRVFGEICQEITEDDTLPEKEFSAATSILLDTQQEISIEQEQEQEVQTEIQEQAEEEMLTYKGCIDPSPYKEISWSPQVFDSLLSFFRQENPVPQKAPLEKIEFYSLPSLLKGIKYQAPYDLLFPDQIRMTSNLAFSTPHLLPVFHDYQKKSGQFLMIRGQKQIFAVLLSKEEAHSVSLILEKSKPKDQNLEFYLVLSNGDFIHTKPKEFSERETRDFDTILWWINFWNGNINYLLNHELLSHRILEKGEKIADRTTLLDLASRFLYLKTLTMGNEKEKIAYEQMTLFNQMGSNQSLRLLTVESLARRKELESTKKILPIDQWGMKQAHLIQGINNKDIPLIKEPRLIQLLTMNQLEFAIKGQIKHFTKHQVELLKKESTKDLFNEALKCFSLREITLNTTDYTLLDEENVNHLIFEKKGAASVVPYLSVDQIGWIRVEDLSAMSSPHFTDAQVKGVRPHQVAYITTPQVRYLSLAEQIEALTKKADLIDEITPVQIQNKLLNREILQQLRHSKQIQAVTEDQIVHLNPDQIPSILPAQVPWIQSPLQLSRIPRDPSFINSITPRQVEQRLLDAELLQELRLPEQIQAVTQEQIQHLKPDQIPSILPAQVPWIQSPLQLSRIPRNSSFINSITARQVEQRLLDAELLQELRLPEQIQAVTQEQIVHLKPDQIPSILPAQVPGLTTQAQFLRLNKQSAFIGNITEPQINSRILTADLIKLLRKQKQIQAVPNEDVPHISADCASLIKADQVPYLNQASQIERLDANNPLIINKIALHQIQARLLNTAFIQKLIDPTKIQAVQLLDVPRLLPAQIEHITGNQVPGISSVDQIQKLKPELYQALPHSDLLVEIADDKFELLTDAQLSFAYRNTYIISLLAKGILAFVGRIFAYVHCLYACRHRNITLARLCDFLDRNTRKINLAKRIYYIRKNQANQS